MSSGIKIASIEMMIKMGLHNLFHLFDIPYPGVAIVI